MIHTLGHQLQEILMGKDCHWHDDSNTYHEGTIKGVTQMGALLIQEGSDQRIKRLTEVTLNGDTIITLHYKGNAQGTVFGGC